MFNLQSKMVNNFETNCKFAVYEPKRLP